MSLAPRCHSVMRAETSVIKPAELLFEPGVLRLLSSAPVAPVELVEALVAPMVDELELGEMDEEELVLGELLATLLSLDGNVLLLGLVALVDPVLAAAPVAAVASVGVLLELNPLVELGLPPELG